MSNNPGVTFQMSEIDTAILISGQPYQRPVREGRLRELTRDWDPGLLDPLVVSYRDGKFYLVDGQHRVAHDPGGKVAEAYRNLTKEVLKLEKQREKCKAGIAR